MLGPKPPYTNRLPLLPFRALTAPPQRQPPPPPLSKPPGLSFLADQCASMDQLKRIHAQMIVTGRVEDAYAASRLLNFCALSQSGDINYALKLFHYTESPNSFMWNTLTRALASSSNPKEALSLYLKMLRLCITPGKHTFPFVLKACSNLKSAECCAQVQAHVLKYGLELDLHVANGLVRGYSVSGRLEDARKVFHEVPERNLSIWTTLICGYAQNDCAAEAIGLFDKMITDGFEPNGITLCSVLSACAQSGCLDIGEQIYAYIQEKGMELGVILGTALVNMYAKNGAILKAKHCFHRLKEKNIMTWNTIICGLAAHGHTEEALEFFKKLEEERARPNDITLVAVLSACCHAGLLDQGRETFYSMKQVYGIDPKIEHYGCMVDLLGRHGRLLEAEQLIRDMAWKADAVIWGALLNACRNYGNVEVANRVVKEMLRLDPNNHGVYVILSNMYAEVGKWEDVLRLRKEMRESYLKKTPGKSLVDGNA